MSFKTVVRIEHPETNYGLFTHEIKDPNFLLMREFENLQKRHNDFPNIWNDSFTWYNCEKVERTKSYKFCSFLSIEQLQKWITTDELKALIEKWGFKVLMIDL